MSIKTQFLHRGEAELRVSCNTKKAENRRKNVSKTKSEKLKRILLKKSLAIKKLGKQFISVVTKIYFLNC